MIKWKAYIGTKAIRLTPKEIGRADPEANVTIVVRPQPDGTWMVMPVGLDGFPFGGGGAAFVDNKSEIQEAVYQQLRMLDKMAGSGGDMAGASRMRPGPKFDKLRAWKRTLSDDRNMKQSNDALRYAVAIKESVLALVADEKGLSGPDGVVGENLLEVLKGLKLYVLHAYRDTNLVGLLLRAEKHVQDDVVGSDRMATLRQMKAHSSAEIAKRHLGRMKTAGEVRFIKDRGGDKNEWGWGSPGPTEREIQDDFRFDPSNLKPLAKALRAALLAMGHTLSAHETFARIKSAQVSPDGSLGGKGYIQKIPDMRRQLMNCVEAMSSFTDTLYDEIKAPHWNPAVKEQGKRERDEVKDIMNDVDEIRSNPEEFAEAEEAEMDDESQGPSGKHARRKQASVDVAAVRVAQRYLLHKEQS